MVMVLGVDVHKDTHTTVAVDQAGREQALCTVRATDAGHEQLVAWARRKFPCELKWAAEDPATCRLVWNEHCSGPERRWYGYRRS
jgi:hypothetical protein